MPRYTFQCEMEDCRLRFEKTLAMGDHPTHVCPSCKETAPRLWSDGFGFQFAEGTPTNSGVHSQDYPTADMAVGRSADKRWAEVKEREKVKKVAREQGETTALMRHDGDGYVDYEPMSDGGKIARRNLADAAIKASRASRPTK